MSRSATLAKQPSIARVVSERTVVTIALTLALFWLGWTAILWYRYHPHLPWRDLFLVLTQVRQMSTMPFDLASLGQWLEPLSGAHRIVIPRLLTLLDSRLLSAQNHLFYATGWVCLLLMVVLYTRLASSYFREPRTVLFTAALATIWLFSPSHSWNLINPINVSWHLSLSFSLLSFYLVLKAPSSPSHWIGAFLLCLLASFCSFVGVVAWMMLPLLAILVQPRAFFPSLLLAAVCAWLYSSGLSTDAEMAIHWNLGSPEAIAKIRAQGEAALAANTTLQIIEKTAKFLGWPLPYYAPRLAMILSLGSIVLLALVFAAALRSSLRSRERLHSWLIFCLTAAGLCLGIVVAIQFGRVLERVDHAHTGSFERYQTVVVVYWLSFSGLLLAAKPRLASGGVVLLAALMGLSWVLQSPSGDYLKQEIESVEAAARLFDRGKLAHSYGSRPIATNIFQLEYVFSFDEYFARHQLAYLAEPKSIPNSDNLLQCADRQSLLLEFATEQSYMKTTDRIPTRAATAVLRTPIAAVNRAIALYQENRLVGRLSPLHRGDYRPSSLLDPRYNQWQGIVGPIGPGELIVVVEGLLGNSTVCKYTPDETW